MKKVIIYIAIFILSMSFVQAQTDTTSAENNKAEQKNEQNKTENQLKGFVDKDGDGIDDRIGKEMNNKKSKMHKGRKRDLFIDKDGDGINDNRCNGFGLPGGNKQNSKHKGHKGRKK